MFVSQIQKQSKYTVTKDYTVMYIMLQRYLEEVYLLLAPAGRRG